MRILVRICEAVFGPRTIPLAGLHRQILEAARHHLKPQHQVAFDAQLAAEPKSRFFHGDFPHLWIRDAGAPRIPLRHRSVLLVRVKFTFEGKAAAADVWAVDGRVAIIEYKGSLGWRPDRVATDIDGKALYRPERHPEDMGPAHPKPARPPAWLVPHLPAGGVEILEPDDVAPRIAPFTSAHIPQDLTAFWKDTGGLTYKALALLGPREVQVRSFAGDDRLVIGYLDHEEIVIAHARPGVLSLLWHDDAPEDLGRSLIEALPALIRRAAA